MDKWVNIFLTEFFFVIQSVKPTEACSTVYKAWELTKSQNTIVIVQSEVLIGQELPKIKHLSNFFFFQRFWFTLVTL